MAAGRPTKYKAKFCDMLAEHLQSGLSVDAFCGVVKVSRQTLYTWFKQHPEFLDTKNDYEGCGRLIWEKIGMQGALGKIKNFNNTAWIFTMKNRFGWHDNVKIGGMENAAPIVLKYNLEDNDEKE